jgi:hypothetical protein
MIIIRLQGGLGNQLFQWAYGHQLSKKHDVYYDVSFFSGAENNGSLTEKRTFELEHVLNKKLNLLNNDVLQYLRDKRINYVADDLNYRDFNFNKNEIYFLNGYWQSEDYFLDSKEEIMDSIVMPNCDEYNFSGSCSIHVRRGDYLKLQHFYPILSIDYYQRALEILKPDGHVFVCSNDIPWCKENFNSERLIFSEKNSNLKDLAIMANCCNNIIANSSFSWWAAFLNRNPDKKVICPEFWFSNNFFKEKDLIPKTWIRI